MEPRGRGGGTARSARAPLGRGSPPRAPEGRSSRAARGGTRAQTCDQAGESAGAGRPEPRQRPEGPGPRPGRPDAAPPRTATRTGPTSTQPTRAGGDRPPVLRRARASRRRRVLNGARIPLTFCRAYAAKQRGREWGARACAGPPEQPRREVAACTQAAASAAAQRPEPRQRPEGPGPRPGRGAPRRCGLGAYLNISRVCRRVAAASDHIDRHHP